MKKEVLIIFMFLGLCFSQTGMMTDKDESGFGIWIEANRDVECGSIENVYIGSGDLFSTDNEYCDQTTVLSLDYMFSFGLELGVDYGVYEDENTISVDGGYDDYTEEYEVNGASLAYHIKNKKGGGFFLGYKESEILYNGVSIPLYFPGNDYESAVTVFANVNNLKTKTSILGFYGKKKTFFEIMQESETIVYMGIDEFGNSKNFEFEYDPIEYINFGGVIKFGKGGLLISYKIDAEAVEMAFDEEDADYLKNGQLTLSLGGVF
tara:strand:- start:30 stop:821 length:792 start_codon:yes stop_codon:yes gene_type:complete